MKRVVLALVALACATCFAASRRDAGDEEGNYGVLLDTPCTLSFISDDIKADPEVHAGEIHFADGKVVQTCYKEHDGLVVIVDENQTMYGPFTADQFK